LFLLLIFLVLFRLLARIFEVPTGSSQEICAMA